MITKPMFNSLDPQANFRIEERDWTACVGGMINTLFQLVMDRAAVGSDFLKCNQAMLSMFSSLYNTLKGYAEGQNNNRIEDKLVMFDWVQVAVGAGNIAHSCLNSYGLFLPQGRLLHAIEFAWGCYHRAQQLENLYKLYRTCLPDENPDAPPQEDHRTELPVTAGMSKDPNLKTGPGSLSTAHWINSAQRMSYMVQFENSPEASLPAQTILIIDTLDPAKFLLSSFSFEKVTVAEKSIDKLYAKSFMQDLDFAKEMGVNARVVGTFDEVTGIVSIHIYTIDTGSQQLTTNAVAGILPPNTISAKGEGAVFFSVQLQPNMTDGMKISNSAAIIFDMNDPIITPSWPNKIDNISPKSAMMSAVELNRANSVLVKWGPKDVTQTDIYTYSVSYLDNDSLWVPWRRQTSLVSDTFAGILGHKYGFYVQAIDSAGNIEEKVAVPEIEIILGTALPATLLDFTANAVGTSNLLSWTTSVELNVSHFDIERSSDAVSYTKIGIQASGGHHYTLTDRQPYSGKNFYRLKIVDWDGRSNYSPVRLVNNTLDLPVKIYPNPVTQGNIIIDYQRAISGRKDISVRSLEGKLVFQLHTNGDIRGTQVVIKLPTNFAKGLYILEVQSASPADKLRRLILIK